MSTKPMKSKLYNRYYASKLEFPTRAGSKGGTVGHKAAKRAVEQKIGRQLHETTKVRTSGNNWVFVEPKTPPSS